VSAPVKVAFIDEQACIGCVKCIVACPVDAIVGAAKFMHTVIANECIGCALCIEPCPMDCITMVAAPVELTLLSKAERVQRTKRRYQARRLRKEMEAAEKAEKIRLQKAALAARLKQHSMVN
jgi:Na+-translocating ferredoxin:NAD+ oxidoreductase subunit B